MLSAQDFLFQKFFAVLDFFKRKEVGKKISDACLVLFPSVLAIIFLILVMIIVGVRQDIQNLGIKKVPIANFSPTAYPFISWEQRFLLPTISAESAIILDKDSRVVVYEKNSNFRFSPASTTKIMTAYTALQYFHLSDILSVKKLIDTQGSGLALTLDEKMTFENLLKAALIYSANDAAVTIAENYPGGEVAFVAAMNANAKKLHLLNTHFGDPAGLDDDNDYTTAQDLIRIAAIAMENPIFADIVNTKNTQITNIDGTDTYTFKNRNILLGIDGINGIKTGYTDQAGEVLATSVVNNGHTFYMIVMKSQDRFADTEKLLPLLSEVNYISFDPNKH